MDNVIPGNRRTSSRLYWTLAFLALLAVIFLWTTMHWRDKAIDLESAAGKVDTTISDLKGKNSKLSGDLDTAKGKVTTLEGELRDLKSKHAAASSCVSKDEMAAALKKASASACKISVAAAVPRQPVFVPTPTPTPAPVFVPSERQGPCGVRVEGVPVAEFPGLSGPGCESARSAFVALYKAKCENRFGDIEGDRACARALPKP